MASNYLRPLFVTVQEREPDQFTWVLVERIDSPQPVYEEIASSPRSLDSYSQAIREGAEALARLSRRHRAGPRCPSDCTIPARDTQTAEDTADAIAATR